MYDVGAIAREPLLLEPLARSVRCGAAPAYLRSLKLKITARCNLSCRMCRYGRGWAPAELATQQLLRVLTEAGELGCRKVHFSGGEVLVRRDFEELVAHAQHERMKVAFTSSLTLLTKARARSLLCNKISSVSTSLDGASAKLHDRIRGVCGSFRRTVRAVSLIGRHRRRGRPKVRINFVMMRDNFRDYPALIELAGDLGACDVVPMPVDTKQTQLRLSKRLIREYNEEIAPRVQELRRATGMPSGDRYTYPFGRTKPALRLSKQGHYAGGYYAKHMCYAPYLHAFIAWDGKVYPCCMTNGRIQALGDVSQQSLASVFLGDRFQSLRCRMLQARLPSCPDCDMMIAENQILAAALGTDPPPLARSHPASGASLLAKAQ